MMKIEIKISLTVKGGKLTKEVCEAIAQGIKDGIKNVK